MNPRMNHHVGFGQALRGFWWPWEAIRSVRARQPAMMAWLCAKRGIGARVVRR